MQHYVNPIYLERYIRRPMHSVNSIARKIWNAISITFKYIVRAFKDICIRVAFRVVSKSIDVEKIATALKKKEESLPPAQITALLNSDQMKDPSREALQDVPNKSTKGLKKGSAKDTSREDVKAALNKKIKDLEEKQVKDPSREALQDVPNKSTKGLKTRLGKLKVTMLTDADPTEASGACSTTILRHSFVKDLAVTKSCFLDLKDSSGALLESSFMERVDHSIYKIKKKWYLELDTAVAFYRGAYFIVLQRSLKDESGFYSESVRISNKGITRNFETTVKELVRTLLEANNFIFIAVPKECKRAELGKRHWHLMCRAGKGFKKIGYICIKTNTFKGMRMKKNGTVSSLNIAQHLLHYKPRLTEVLSSMSLSV